MTLRDLTKREAYNLQRRCRKLFKAWISNPFTQLGDPERIWIAAYNAGLKDGLAKGDRHV